MIDRASKNLNREKVNRLVDTFFNDDANMQDPYISPQYKINPREANRSLETLRKTKFIRFHKKPNGEYLKDDLNKKIPIGRSMIGLPSSFND